MPHETLSQTSYPAMNPLESKIFEAYNISHGHGFKAKAVASTLFGIS